MSRARYTAVAVGIAFLLVGVLVGYGLWGGTSSDGGCAVTITEGGSTTVQPLAERWAEGFETTHPNVNVIAQGGGSSAGVKGAAEGTFDIGAASRDIKESELSQWPAIVPLAVARDGVAIVLHPSNPVSNLSLEEVRGIFAAEITDWSEVGGPAGAITMVSREEVSGTRETFENMVMGEAEIAASAEFFPSNGAVKQKVAATQGSIGYISLGYVDSSVKAVSVDGVACTAESCRDGSYPVARSLYFVTLGQPTGEVLDFINYCLSPQGQDIVEEEGYISIR